MKSKKNEAEVVIVSTPGIGVSRSHLSFIYFLISWPIVYLLCYVTRPVWIVGDNGYITQLTGGSGTANASPKPSFTNSVLSDAGRENILWVSFLFALLVGLLDYLLLSYY
jgi:hypothetical protein